MMIRSRDQPELILRIASVYTVLYTVQNTVQYAILTDYTVQYDSQAGENSPPPLSFLS